MRVQKVIHHPEFKKAMEMIDILEKKRKFCGHGIEHLMDTARIAYIENIETSLGFEKDVVYSAGLLHDVGKYLQYTQGIDHHIGSERLAAEILSDAGYNEEERDIICRAIITHRSRKASAATPLGSILYKADKISRACYICEAADRCSWSDEKRTAGVIS